MSVRGARWAAAVAVIVVAVLVGAASIWMIRNVPEATDSAADQVPGIVPISALQFGDCYGIPRDARGNITTAAGVYLVSCDKEHDGQVLEQVELDNLDWAGTTAMKASAQNQCTAAFNRYRASITDPTGLLPGYFLPDEPEWAAGNRTITCTVTMEAPFTGSKL